MEKRGLIEIQLHLLRPPFPDLHVPSSGDTGTLKLCLPDKIIAFITATLRVRCQKATTAKEAESTFAESTGPGSTTKAFPRFRLIIIEICASSDNHLPPHGAEYIRR